MCVIKKKKTIYQHIKMCINIHLKGIGPLHVAVVLNRVEVANALLQHELIDVNLRDEVSLISSLHYIL
jgi:hypothetical protein